MEVTERQIASIVKSVIAGMQLKEDTSAMHGVFADMDTAIAKAKEAQKQVRLMSMDQATWQRKEDLEQAIIEQLKGAMARGEAASAEAAQLADLHVQWIQLQWGDGTYSRDAHLGLAQGYLADDRFRDYYDSRAGEGATEFLVAALDANL